MPKSPTRRSISATSMARPYPVGMGPLKTTGRVSSPPERFYLHSGSLSQRLFRKYRGGSGDDAESQSHPGTWDRINRAVENAVACVAADQAEVVRNYLNEIVAVVRFVENEVFPIVAGVIDQA